MEALNWFSECFQMEIIPIEMINEGMYHLDCVLFPITKEKVLLCTEFGSKITLSKIEKVAEIIPAKIRLGKWRIFNCVRCGDHILFESSIEEFSTSDEVYAIEKEKLETISNICQQYGLKPNAINLSEFYKSGASLSCLVMHLNFY